MTSVSSIQPHQENKSNVEKAKRRFSALFYCLTIGVVLTISAIASLQTLQTSINIEGNVGAISLTSAYIVSILFSIFLSPTILQNFGPNFTIVLADFCFLAYVLSNIYPEIYVLTPGAMISGVGRSVLFPATTMIIMKLSTHYTKYGSKKSYDVYFNHFLGRFYSIFNSVSIFGNLLSYVILYSTNLSSSSGETNSPDNVTVSTPTNDVAPTPQSNHSKYIYCGVNDCQDPSVVSDNIDQYVPPEQISVYILIFVSSCLCVIAIFLHWFIFPGIGAFSHKLEQIDQDMKDLKNEKQKDIESSENSSVEPSKTNIFTNNNNNNNVEEDFSTKSPYCYDNPGLENDVPNNKHEISTSFSKQTTLHNGETIDEIYREYQNIEEMSMKSEEENKSVNTKRENKNYWSTLKATFLFFLIPRALLLNIATFHYGMLLGFVLSDITRAYASCVAGVQMTGLFAVIFGIAGIISAFLYGKWGSYLGRNITLALATVVEFIAYVGCYVWEPDPNTIVVVYFIFITFGLVNGIARLILIVIYSDHFSDCKPIALSVWNFWFMAGLATQYGLSTAMCVKDKLYMMVAFLFIGNIFYGIAEYIFYVGKKKEEENSCSGAIESTQL